MADEPLTPNDERLFNYIKDGNFLDNPWISADVAQALGMTETEVHEGLSRLAKHKKGKFYIGYKAGYLRVAAE